MKKSIQQNLPFARQFACTVSMSHPRLAILEEALGLYTFPFFNKDARNEELCRLALQDDRYHKDIAKSMRVILPPSSSASEAGSPEQDTLRESLLHRIPVYFGSIKRSLFHDSKFKKLTGYTAKQAMDRIDLSVRYALCGRVLASSAAVAKPKYAYVGHAWGINFETKKTADYARFIVPSTGRIRRDLYEKTQDDMCAMIVQCAVHAMTDAGAASVELLVSSIGMGAFMTSITDESDRDWAMHALVRSLSTQARKTTTAHPGVNVRFYSERAAVHRAATEHEHFRIVGGDIFRDAGNYLKHKPCVCVINSWDPVSFVGNGGDRDATIDGMIASGLGDGAAFANTCYLHNVMFMPSLLEASRWMVAGDLATEEPAFGEAEGAEDAPMPAAAAAASAASSTPASKNRDRRVYVRVSHGQYLAPVGTEHAPDDWHGVDGVKGLVRAQEAPYVWTLKNGKALLDHEGHPWEVYMDDDEDVDYILLWRRFNGKSKQTFEFKDGRVLFHDALRLWVDTDGFARLSSKKKGTPVRIEDADEIEAEETEEDVQEEEEADAPAAAKPRFWKHVPKKLPCSLFYLAASQASVIRKNFPGLTQFVPHLPCWIPTLTLSEEVYGNVAALKKAERQHGYFLWATEFSNAHTTWSGFKEPSIELDGEIYHGGPEVPYQLMKYEGTKDFAAVKRAIKKLGKKIDPVQAWELGQPESGYISRADWLTRRVPVMEKAIFAKFTQTDALAQLLDATYPHPLVQLKPDDAFWGTGKDGKGENMLGTQLSTLREQQHDSS
jgi:ribA/ribD-fused uncharacterized protein